METRDKIQIGFTKVNTDFGNKITSCIKDGGCSRSNLDGLQYYI